MRNFIREFDEALEADDFIDITAVVLSISTFKAILFYFYSFFLRDSKDYRKWIVKSLTWWYYLKVKVFLRKFR